jgi:RecG-like helicase
VQWRRRVVVEGRVRSVRVVRIAGSCTLECVVEDGSGAVSVVFLGRARIPGVEVGTRMRVKGTAGERQGRLAILNPDYELMPTNA